MEVSFSPKIASTGQRTLVRKSDGLTPMTARICAFAISDACGGRLLSMAKTSSRCRNCAQRSSLMEIKIGTARPSSTAESEGLTPYVNAVNSLQAPTLKRRDSD